MVTSIALPALLYSWAKKTVNQIYIQVNYNSSNTDGLFTMANSNSFLSPYEILPVAQEKKYLGNFLYFIMKLYVVYIHENCLIEAILKYLTYHYCIKYQKDFPKLSPFASWPGTMILSGSSYPYLK